MLCKNPKKKQLTGNVRIYPNKDQALLSFHSKKPISVLETTIGDYGLLFYKNGSNHGEINFLKIQREKEQSIHHGMRYWTWTLTDTLLEFDDWEVRDFAVLLPKAGTLGGGEEGYTVITKEWSPAMLEDYEYSSVGIETKTEQYERQPIMSHVNGKWEVVGWEERPLGELQGSI